MLDVIERMLESYIDIDLGLIFRAELGRKRAERKRERGRICCIVSVVNILGFNMGTNTYSTYSQVRRGPEMNRHRNWWETTTLSLKGKLSRSVGRTRIAERACLAKSNRAHLQNMIEINRSKQTPLINVLSLPT